MIVRCASVCSVGLRSWTRHVRQDDTVAKLDKKLMTKKGVFNIDTWRAEPF